MKDKKNKYFCILGGGAVRGLTYVGVLKALKEQGVGISGYAGASAGAIAAVMMALDYTVDEMREVLGNFDYMTFRDLNFSLKIELALSKGEIFTDKIREIIANKLGTDAPVTFKDFPGNLHILTSNLSTGKCEVFSRETTPDFEVAQAVRISAAFPGLMNPYEYNGNLYVDGDLVKSCALSQISPLLNPTNERILEFRLEGSKVQNMPKNPLEFLNNAVDFVTNIATENVVETFSGMDKYDFIVLEANDTLLFDFSISNEKKDALVNYGYETTKNYFVNILPEKRKYLTEVYETLQKAVLRTYEYLLKRKYSEAKNVLNEYVSLNYNKIELLDENIVKKVNEVVDGLNNGISKTLFFVPRLENHNQLKEMASELIDSLNKKICI